MPAAPLADVGVLVTRPREQADAFAAELKQLGATPWLLPALAILPTGDTEALKRTMQAAGACTLAIFVSPTAVTFGLAALRRHHPDWPQDRTTIAAVGMGTARALHQAGIGNVLVPETGADSEHLLALPRLQAVAHENILILRGEGGRTTLAETLVARGAHLLHAECYRRGMPQPADLAPQLAATRTALHAGSIHAITVFSSETLDNLFHLLGPDAAAALRATPLFAAHARIAEHARQLGCSNVMTAADAQLTPRLVEYFAHD